MTIQDYFIAQDVFGAIEYMKEHSEYQDVLPMYISLFENEKYLQYGLPKTLEDILLTYQVYYREIFYLKRPKIDSENDLKRKIRELIQMPQEEEKLVIQKLEELFLGNGYHALFGKTQGIYGPYIWSKTVKATYQIELPNSTEEYTVNILSGFLFKSFMDYLTFGGFGTAGWASEDGTINCIESAYDFEGEKFKVSLLKHEAQHTKDIREYPNITPFELEYRAKLVELIYSSSTSLLQKLLSEASQKDTADSHAMANYRIKEEFSSISQNDIETIQSHARKLFFASNDEMNGKYK